MSDIAEFVPNVVQSLAFKYARPKMVQSRSGERAMFSLTDGRIAFWDPPVAERIVALGVRVNEPFNVCLRRNGNSKSWDFWLAPEGERTRAHEEHPGGFGEQRDGTFAVPAVLEKNDAKASPTSAPFCATAAPQAPRNGAASISPIGSGTAKSLTHSGWALAVREQTNALIDVYADCCQYASERHSGVVSRDDVRAILMNRLISGGRR